MYCVWVMEKWSNWKQFGITISTRAWICCGEATKNTFGKLFLKMNMMISRYTQLLPNNFVVCGQRRKRAIRSFCKRFSVCIRTHCNSHFWGNENCFVSLQQWEKNFSRYNTLVHYTHTYTHTQTYSHTHHTHNTYTYTHAHTHTTYTEVGCLVEN